MIHHQLQARNQEFFKARKFSWNSGISINVHLQHKKERPRREKMFGFFRLETLKNCILNENVTHRWPQSGHFFPQIKALFSNFWKRTGETFPRPPPSSFVPEFAINISHQKFVNISSIIKGPSASKAWHRFDVDTIFKIDKIWTSSPRVFYCFFFLFFFLLLLFFSLRNRTGVTSNFVAWCKACSCFYFVLWNLFSPLETYSKPNLDFELLIIWCKFKLKWISNIKISLTLKSHWLLYWVCRHST